MKPRSSKSYRTSRVDARVLPSTGLVVDQPSEKSDDHLTQIRVLSNGGIVDCFRSRVTGYVQSIAVVVEG
jgi:hypothetical protein